MHHLLLVLYRIYPYWAFPLIIILIEVGIFFRRKQKDVQYLFWGSCGLLGVGIILWFLI